MLFHVCCMKEKELIMLIAHNKKDAGIALTFDDGPSEVITAKVLELLRQYNAKATFFCIGKNVISHPDIVKKIIKNGSAIGNHTHNHVF